MTWSALTQQSTSRSSSDSADLQAAIAASGTLDSSDVRSQILAQLTKGRGSTSSGNDGAFKPREIASVQIDDTKLQIRSKCRDQSTKNIADFMFRVDNCVVWKLAFKHGDNDSASSALAFRVALFRLIEYIATVTPKQSQNFLDFKKIQGATWTSLKSGLSSTVNTDGATVKSLKTSLVFSNDAKFNNLNDIYRR
jgi:hypothetical protein